MLLTVALKERLSETQNHRCCFCGKRMGVTRDRNDYPTFEHITPKSLGGSDELDNLVISCRGCNEARGISLTWTGPFGFLSRLDEIETKLNALRDYLTKTDNVPGRKKLANLLKDTFWLLNEVKTRN